MHCNIFNVCRKTIEKPLATLRRLKAIVLTLTLRTHKKRWEKVAYAGQPEWDLRNKKLVSFIPSGSSVIDIGCGAQTLKQHLPVGCSYQPCDLVKSSPDVILCDFNANHYPKVDRQFTHVVCSGVLEYIRDPDRFLNEISSLGGTVILSYNLRLPGDSKLQRMTNNWVNHFSQLDLDVIFRKAGLQSECLDRTQTGEVIFRLRQDNATAQHQASSTASRVK